MSDPKIEDLDGPANTKIYSPEWTDEKGDWPTKLVTAAFVIIAIAFLMILTGWIAKRHGVMPWWSVFG